MRLQSVGRVLRNLRAHLPGRCNVCGRPTLFFCVDPAHQRNNMWCLFCRSSSRKRHVAKLVLEGSGALSIAALADAAKRGGLLPRILNTDAHDAFGRLLGGTLGYAASDFLPGVPPGTPLGPWWTCQDLERLTLPDASFEVLITEDVLEHVRSIDRALAEARRVLAPGGRHVFTVPYDAGAPTLVRVDTSSPEDRHLLPPEYHDDTIRGKILAYRTFGSDMGAILARHGFDLRIDECGAADRRAGIVASTAFVATRR